GRVRTIEEISVVFQAESLATHGNPAVPQAGPANLFYGKVDRAGRPQAASGLGQAVVVLPWYGLGRLLGLLPGVPPGTRDIVVDAAVTASSATFSALAAALALLIFLRLGLAARPAVAAALLLALATPLFSYSAWLFSEPLAAALFLGAALFLFTGDANAAIPARDAYRAGLLLGVAIWIRPAHAVAATVFFVALVARNVAIRSRGGKPNRSAFVLAAVVLLFFVAFLIRNKILFGSPLDFGYPAAAGGIKPPNSFDTPLLRGLFGFLISPGKSIFIFAPPILLALAGIRRLAQRDLGLAIVAVLTPVAYLFYFARYAQWEGGYCFGPRYLVAPLALLCLGLGPVFAAVSAPAGAWARRAAWVLFFAGFAVQIIGMSTSFVEDEITGAYYNQQGRYRMSYDPLVSQTRLLLRYIETPTVAPIGRGFDRWVIFLLKVGISRGLVMIFWGLEWAGAIFFTWKLEGLLAKPPPPDMALA
ncbi:MAG: hypothetical protein ACREGH_03710, partial [Minisyncoccia bacterium]